MQDAPGPTRTLVGFCLAAQIVILLLLYTSGHGNAVRAKLKMLPSCQAGIPEGLRGAPYIEELGCWHVRSDPAAASSPLHVAVELNFAPGERWQEVLRALKSTQTENPHVHYIFATSSTVSLNNMERSQDLVQLPHDVWFCPEVLYGTPIAIGNRYSGAKMACSVDNWIPTMDWKCNFTESGSPVVFVVQRRDSKDLSGSDVSCEAYRDMGSADGIMFDYIPEEAIKYLRFHRTYWGCENVALYVLKRAGIKLVNLCPSFRPTHLHKIQDRDPGRLRINHPANSVHSGDHADLGKYCAHVT